ncbi:hypothetical protein A0H81_10632 [Grifola frondosa]|uniref:Uncharacterized protein n=1 Tax=Grifola frondosa TaxID=5627 RepID=A0A1C7LYY7_GRIFR|nr:hypothetical protein A0H81_10632 [Grifola frondosa]
MACDDVTQLHVSCVESASKFTPTQLDDDINVVPLTSSSAIRFLAVGEVIVLAAFGFHFGLLLVSHPLHLIRHSLSLDHLCQLLWNWLLRWCMVITCIKTLTIT